MSIKKYSLFMLWYQVMFAVGYIVHSHSVYDIFKAASLITMLLYGSKIFLLVKIEFEGKVKRIG